MRKINDVQNHTRTVIIIREEQHLWKCIGTHYLCVNAFSHFVYDALRSFKHLCHTSTFMKADFGHCDARHLCLN